MKSKRWILRICLLCFLLFVTVPVQAAGKSKGLVKKGNFYYFYNSKGEKLINKWKTIDGERYYFGYKGRAVVGGKIIGNNVYVFNEKGRLCHPKTKRVLTVGSNKYYVDPKGRATTKWFVVGDRLYYADPKGRLYLNDRSREGITFTKYGYANKNTASDLKIQVMSIISRITNDSMTKEQKLRAAWNYVISHMSYYSRYPSGNAGWHRELAYLALKSGIGNCYGYACAFAALAREIGYDPYLYCGRVPGSRDGASDGYTRHCWVVINGCHYDPEGQALGWLKGVYGYGYYPCSYKLQYTVRFAS